MSRAGQLQTPVAGQVTSQRLKKTARLSAWALLIGLIVLMVSGWGISQTGVVHRVTFGLIDRKLADSIHRATNTPITFFFLVHVLVNIKLAISARHPSRSWLTNTVLIVAGIAIFAMALYLDVFRKGG